MRSTGFKTMADKALSAIIALVSAIIFLAVVSVVLSQKAATTGVISAAGNALSNVIGAAVNPVSGNGSSFSTNSLNIGSGIITNLTGSLN